MGLEKFVLGYGLVKSVRELREIGNGDSVADGMGYHMKAFEVIGVGLLNVVYVVVAATAVYSLING